jgi:hypothetical protein
VLPSLTDGTHAYSLCQSGEHRSKRSNSQDLFANLFLAPLPFPVTNHRREAGSWRIGSFLLDSPQMLLMGKLPVPKWLPPDPDDVQAGIEMMGACKLHNARPGIWITGTCSLPRGHLCDFAIPRCSDHSFTVCFPPVEWCRHACDAMPNVQPQQLPR